VELAERWGMDRSAGTPYSTTPERWDARLGAVIAVAEGAFELAELLCSQGCDLDFEALGWASDATVAVLDEAAASAFV
jgi:hypothetical protein